MVPVRTVALLALLGFAVVGCAARDSGGPERTGTTPSTSAPGPTTPGTPAPSPTATTGGPSPSATTGPPLSRTALPTAKPPTRGYTPPSDQFTGVWVLGTVTRGGDGPCYGLRTDDGRLLAIYGPGAGTLTDGARIRALVRPLERPVDCGPGETMRLLGTKRAR